MRGGMSGQLHLPHRGVRDPSLQPSGTRPPVRRASRRPDDRPEARGEKEEARQGRSQEGHGGLIVAFVFLAAMTLISALGVVLSRNVVHSALFMSASFLGVAGFFVMLNAPALAAFQVLIYVGAVTVLILFGIMFTQRPQVGGFRTIIQRQLWPGLFVAIGIGAFLAYVLSTQDWVGTEPGNGPREVAALGEILLGVNGAPPIFGLLFEVASVLLLVAIVAAIVVSRRKTGEGVGRGGE